MTQRYAVINETPVNKKHGGAVMTLQALLEPRQEQVNYYCCDDLSQAVSEDYDAYILGNVHGHVDKSLPFLDKILRTKKAVCIQFDYVWCQFRSEICHTMATGEKCQCPMPGSPYSYLWNLQKRHADHIFFMSEGQRKIFQMHTSGLTAENSSVLSSAFAKEHLDMFKELRETTMKTEGYAIIHGGMDAYGSHCKGIDVSIEFAKAKKLEHNVLMQGNHTKLMKDLARHKGLIFLPRNHDTCPRITLEARLLDCQVIVNTYVQHATEKWWLEGGVEATEKYLRERPEYFWSKIDEICG
jgi:hypothetical protein